jgi:hypothetical protein
MFGVGINIFLDRGYHRITLGSAIRPYRPKTGDFDWTFRVNNIYVMLWALYNLLGTSDKVCAHTSRHLKPLMHIIYSVAA